MQESLAKLIFERAKFIATKAPDCREGKGKKGNPLVAIKYFEDYSIIYNTIFNSVRISPYLPVIDAFVAQAINEVFKFEDNSDQSWISNLNAIYQQLTNQ